MLDQSKYNLDFRPESYFKLTDPSLAALNRISGTARRRAVEQAIKQGETVPAELLEPSLSKELRAALSRIHPSLMGGEFLPESRREEIEIARIDLDSCTADAISLRARPGSDRIRYRIVDEYMEDCEYRLSQKSSRKPLTLKQVIRLLDESQYYLRGALQPGGIVNESKERILNCDSSLSSLESIRHFTRVTSDFYPELDSWYQQAAEDWYNQQLTRLGHEKQEDEEGGDTARL